MPLSRKPFSPPRCIMHAPGGKTTKQNYEVTNSSHNIININNNTTAQVKRLTRQRKLRHLHYSSSSDDDDDDDEYYSQGGSGGGGHWSSSAVPQPLPLPKPQLMIRRSSVEYCNYDPRKTVNHGAMISTKLSSNLDRPTLDPPVAKAKYNNLRVKIPAKKFLTVVNAGNNNSCKNHTSVSYYYDDSDVESISGLSLHVFAKSAPSTVFTSPVNSPCGSSSIDIFDHTINFLQKVNEDLKQLPAETLHKDHSFNPKIQEGFLQHHKSLCTVLWSENNNHVDAHPLPLPPRVSPPPPQPALQHNSSTIMHHVIDNSLSMKGQWQKGKLIGRGTFGSVYHATNLETGASCAMKEVDLIPDDPTSAECIKQLEQEIKILQQLHHPNIVQYYGREIVGDHLYIYMEYVHPGSVHKFIREHCGAMTESVVRNFTRHILSGLAYLHSTKTIHRDIKGANLLVNESGMVKLADFGMAKILTGNSYELSLKGSPYWMAPEVMNAARKKESNPDLAMAIDIWSLGCTIIEMLTGKPPWSEFEVPSAMLKVLQHNIPPIPETLSSVGKDFLQQCFRRDPIDRPSAAKLLKHSFVQNLHDHDVLVHPQLYHRGVGLGQGVSPNYTS